MEAKTDPDISRKLSQFSTDGCSIEYGTFDKYGFIYIPPCIGEQCQSVPGTGDCAAATQASLLQEPPGDAPPGEGEVQKTPITKDCAAATQVSLLQESDTSDKIAPPWDAPPGEGEVQKKPITKDCAAATHVSLLQESDTSDKIALPGEGEVQKTPITKDCAAATQVSLLQENDTSNKVALPGDAPQGEGEVKKINKAGVGDVIVDKLTKRELDADSPEIVTGGFRRAKLMDNLRSLVKINKMSNGMGRKKRKTSGE